jgi:hypothetical protein
MVLKTQYQDTVCKICERYADDALFEIGFFDPIIIRLRGDFGHTEDRVLAINERFLEALSRFNVHGYEAKPLGASGWYALRITERVDCDERVMDERKPFCRECGRAERVIGEFSRLDQIRLPTHPRSLFTTKKAWAKPFRDRTIFLTQEAVEALKEAGVKGGWCNRLWTGDEVLYAEKKAAQGKKWKPPGSIVTL